MPDVMLESLLDLDRSITLVLNGSSSLYVDNLMSIATLTVTWVPVGLVMLYVVIKNNEPSRVFAIIGLLVACFLVSNTLSEICKALTERFRPSNEPMLMGLVQVVNGYRGSNYGFFSAHAANTMSIAVFLSLLFRRPKATVLMVFWSVLNGWTRVYLGLHYFGDVIVGFVVGALVGAALYALYSRFSVRIDNSGGMASTEYTTGGYLATDIDIMCATLIFTFAVVAVVAAACPF